MTRIARSLFAAAALAAPIAFAADGEGRFAVDGAGALDCARFGAAREEGGAGAALFLGWIGGYATGFNHFRADTFDVTPWQTVELLALKLDAFCETRPETRFVDAMNRLLAALEPQKLSEESEVVRLSRNGRAVFVYRAMLERIRAALVEAGFPPADASPDALTDALARLQSLRGLAVSGLPDQPTLNALFPR